MPPDADHLEEEPSIEIIDPPSPRKTLPPKRKPPLTYPDSDTDEPIEFVEGSSRKNSQRQSMKGAMLPPLHPASLSFSSPIAPEPSFAVRPVQRKKKIRTVIQEPESPDLPPPSQRRLHRHQEVDHASAELRSKRKGKEKSAPLMHNPLFDFEATHSGDEVSEGSSHSEDDVESDSDRRFLEALPETQASPSYDQSLIYRKSLLTQAPGAPKFANRPIRKGIFGTGFQNGQRVVRRPNISSSPPRDSDEPDEYMLDSFLVDDEADISYVGSSDL